MAVLLSVLCFPLLSYAQHDFDRSVLNEPESLYLKNGRGLIGKALRVEENRLVFVSTSGNGYVEYRFSADEVERLDFAGNNFVIRANELYAEENYAEAVALMEMLYNQRARFFAFMSQAQVAWFQKLADSAYLAGDYFLAVGVARNLRPFVKDPRTTRQLKDRELLAHYHLPLLNKTKALAKDWVAQWLPYGESALGWYVLGQIAFDEEHPREALWYCLRPIVFSSQFKTDYLNHAYALAIISAVALEDWQQAQTLLDEMKVRHLSWPKEVKLEPYRDYYEVGIPQPEETPAG